MNRTYTLSWDELPKALFEDAHAFKEASLSQNLFDLGEARRPVRPATADQRDRMIRRLASAELRAGVDRSALQSLADLVHPDQLQRGLEFFIERNDGAPNKQVSDMAQLALGIAKHWAVLPEDQISTIMGWANKVRVRQEGMTERNRERLRQFTDTTVINAFLNLPDALVEKARRRPEDSRSALQVQTAIAIGILCVAPLRIQNLRCLDRDKHFHRAFSVDAPHHQLVIPAGEVKNKIDLEFPVPPWLMKLINLYFASYQPLLTNGYPSSLLFPGRTGQPKHDTALRRNITDAVYKELGLRVHPHLCRHLGAYLFLKLNPGQYESVRQLLGHKNIQTTINFYASLETDAATQLYNRVIDHYREDPGPNGPLRMIIGEQGRSISTV